MIEVVFSFLLGVAIISSLCGVMPDHSRGDRILLCVLACVVLLACLSSFGGAEPKSLFQTFRELLRESFTSQLPFFLIGGVLALFIQLIDEGHIYKVWVLLHPQSAPTPEVHMGQRAKIAGFRQAKTPATLVGTSTTHLSAELDLYTETLIRLSYSVFEDRGALTMSRLEGELRLGTGHRQKAYHKIVAGNRGRPNVKRIAHRYWRSVNGSSRMSQSLFGDLCKLARNTNNRDRATINRLMTVGTALSLSPEDMGRAIQGAL